MEDINTIKDRHCFKNIYCIIVVFSGLFAPGIVGVAMGCLILLGVKDSPESAGFPPVEGDITKPEKTDKQSGAVEKKETLLDLLVNDVLKYELLLLFHIFTDPHICVCSFMYHVVHIPTHTHTN